MYINKSVSFLVDANNVMMFDRPIHSHVSKHSFLRLVIISREKYYFCYLNVS